MSGAGTGTEARALRELEANLDASAQQALDLIGTEAYITPDEILGTAYPFREGQAEEAAAFNNKICSAGAVPAVIYNWSTKGRPVRKPPPRRKV